MESKSSSLVPAGQLICPILPVTGVPGVGPHLDGMDSLMSIVQMPRGYPVGTVAIGEWGAVNAGILAAQIIGLIDSDVQEKLENRRAKITAEIESVTYVKPAGE